MALDQIKALSMNPHFFSKVIQSFLSGYNKPCDIQFVFMAVPVLLYKSSRERLYSANSLSKLETIFKADIEQTDGEALDGRTRFAGLLERFSGTTDLCKEALIILSSENKIQICGRSIILNSKLDYKKFSNSPRNWLRAASYLGMIFSKTSKDHLFYYLGVGEA